MTTKTSRRRSTFRIIRPLLPCLLFMWTTTTTTTRRRAYVQAFGPNLVSQQQSRTNNRQQKQRQPQQMSSSPNFYNDFEGYGDDQDGILWSDNKDERNKIRSNIWKDNNNNDDTDDDEEDDDDNFWTARTADQMDWRRFRQQLTTQQQDNIGDSKNNYVAGHICQENQDVLQHQNPTLHREFESGAVWAHVTATPEVGNLVVRMPLEVELQRNGKHSIVGARLLAAIRNDDSSGGDNNNNDNNNHLVQGYARAQAMIDRDLKYLMEQAAVDGQIDATSLSDDLAEMLTLYLDHQETWQEVCLVLEQDVLVDDSEEDWSYLANDDDDDDDDDIVDAIGIDRPTKTTSTLVLNRPMCMKLTEHLGQLVLYGVYKSSGTKGSARKAREPEFQRFMRAFGSECAVYIGGPDDQDQPAELIHGIADLPGAQEIAPKTGIYRGGLAAAVTGVLRGQYKPLEFRFFVGRHVYHDSELDLSSVVLGKYQPVACARAVALKQCISLPKPLWHEVLELCGGDCTTISQMELEKRDDLQIQIVDDDDDDDDYSMSSEIVDELDRLSLFDDDDDEEDDDDDDDDDDDYYYHR